VQAHLSPRTATPPAHQDAMGGRVQHGISNQRRPQHPPPARRHMPMPPAARRHDRTWGCRRHEDAAWHAEPPRHRQDDRDVAPSISRTPTTTAETRASTAAHGRRKGPPAALHGLCPATPSGGGDERAEGRAEGRRRQRAPGRSWELGFRHH
jgi:hypothetical protein